MILIIPSEQALPLHVRPLFSRISTRPGKCMVVGGGGGRGCGMRGRGEPFADCCLVAKSLALQDYMSEPIRLHQILIGSCDLLEMTCNLHAIHEGWLWD